MADKKTSGNGNGNGSSSHEYINEAGIGNADDEDYCKKVQCNLDLVTLLVSAKTDTKSHNVTK